MNALRVCITTPSLVSWCSLTSFLSSNCTENIKILTLHFTRYNRLLCNNRQKYLLLHLD
ncbi:hypothetical protein HanXRQr2_Chr15g0708031 [Helianthus annuus]|uniref:Uncharacterized protein n=1 Tax=Helianthus annuus TaxID=4232 RepID=A0A9K3E2D0_HELAN|nr:hypothetical protein HanXRQr2_Chr15g0708031 [Helianthus annuus]KAJ0832513.1 hypothetical protein HanPSC8_Chr15g0679621 [Helianthus annuus]